MPHDRLLVCVDFASTRGTTAAAHSAPGTTVNEKGAGTNAQLPGDLVGYSGRGCASEPEGR